MQAIWRSASVWVLVGLIVSFLLQVVPYTGIYLMLVGGGLFTGLLVHVFLASVALEALAGRLPRACLLLPVLAYGGYYAAYLHQGILIALKSAELRAGNPRQLLPFDPGQHALIVPEAGYFVRGHLIDVAYEANPNYSEQHLSYRLFRREDCDRIRNDTQSRIQKMGVHFGGKLQKHICEMRQPERPTRNQIKIGLRGNPEIWKRKWQIQQQTTDLEFEGQLLGSYTTAHVWRLPAFPAMFIGCGLVSSKPAWECAFDFRTTRITIDGVPAGVDTAVYDVPVSIMLGVRRYTAQEIADFTGHAGNAAALSWAMNEANRVEDEVFEQLEAILEGKAIKLPHNMGYSLAQRPDRLAPFAKPMLDLFLAVHETKKARKPFRREELEMLSIAIPALPPDAFAEIAGRVLAVAQADSFWHDHPVLYLRAADFGPSALGLYREHIMAGTVKGYLSSLPALAVCRIGQADPELIEKLKQDFVAFDFEKPNRREETAFQALFVTLVKLGQTEFVSQHLGEKVRDRSWYEAVLAGKGTTAIGPNNCMVANWPSTAYLAKAMAASLKRRGVSWATE